MYLNDGESYTDLLIEVPSNGVINNDWVADVVLVDNGTYEIGNDTASVNIGDDGEAAGVPASLVLDFNGMAFTRGGIDWTITWSVNGRTFGGGEANTINIPENATTTQVRDAVDILLRAGGLTATRSGETGLTVTGPAGRALSGLTIFAQTAPELLPTGPSATPVRGTTQPAPVFSYQTPT